MKGFLHVLRDLALLIARLVLGAVLIMHGWYRWRVEGIGRSIEMARGLGIPAAEAYVVGTTIAEIAGGILLIFGLLTPLVGLVVVALAALDIVFVRWANGPLIARQGYEYAAVTGALGLLFAVFGAGRAAVDQLFRRTPEPNADLDYNDNDPA